MDERIEVLGAGVTSEAVGPVPVDRSRLLTRGSGTTRGEGSGRGRP